MSDEKKTGDHAVSRFIAIVAGIFTIVSGYRSCEDDGIRTVKGGDNITIVQSNPTLPRTAEAEIKARTAVPPVEPPPTQSHVPPVLASLADYMSVKSGPRRVDYSVSVREDANRQAAGVLQTLIVEHLQSSGKSASAAIFTGGFCSSEFFDRMFDGQATSEVQKSTLAQVAEHVLLAHVSTNSRSGSSVSGLISVDIRASFVVLSARDGATTDRFDIMAVGPGTSAADAENSAFARVVELLAKKGY